MVIGKFKCLNCGFTFFKQIDSKSNEDEFYCLCGSKSLELLNTFEVIQKAIEEDSIENLKTSIGKLGIERVIELIDSLPESMRNFYHKLLIKLGLGELVIRHNKSLVINLINQYLKREYKATSAEDAEDVVYLKEIEFKEIIQSKNRILEIIKKEVENDGDQKNI